MGRKPAANKKKTKVPRKPRPPDIATSADTGPPPLPVAVPLSEPTQAPIVTSITLPFMSLPPTVPPTNNILPNNSNLSSESDPSVSSSRTANSCTTTTTSNTNSRHHPNLLVHDNGPKICTTPDTNVTQTPPTVHPPTSITTPPQQPTPTDDTQEDPHLSSTNYHSDSSLDECSHDTSTHDNICDTDDSITSSPQ